MILHILKRITNDLTSEYIYEKVKNMKKENKIRTKTFKIK